MSRKHSTGYFTPQASKKRNSKSRHTESNDDLSIGKELSDSFFEKLMSCPVKRQLVLALINSEKDNIDAYKRSRAKEDQRKENNASPLSKIKRNYCESPTALLRRRALKQQKRYISEIQCQDLFASSSDSSSTQSSVSNCSSPIPLDKLLDGVIAYVEIKCKDQDKSDAAKMLMKSMGATVRDEFTKDVTHVIFKDGSFITYQKAKLMKVHLVSVLWIEAIRSNKMRIPENKFPALGTEACNSNVSGICSQLQKDYEEMIRDELHRSLTTGTPLPSTQDFIERRRTIMTPHTSSTNTFPQELSSSQDKEVETIFNSQRKTYTFSSGKSLLPSKSSSDLVSDDDSDLRPVIDGLIVKRKNKTVMSNLKKDPRSSFSKIQEDSNMDLTYLDNSTFFINNVKIKHIDKSLPQHNVVITELNDENVSNSIQGDNTIENGVLNTPNQSIYNKDTPKLKKTNNRRTQSSNGNIGLNDRFRRRTRQLISDSNKSNEPTNISSDYKTKTNIDTTSSTNTAALELPQENSGLHILSKNVTSSSCNNIQNIDSVALDSLSNEIAQKSSSTNMSSLQVSSSREKSTSKEKFLSSSTMSALLITSDSSKDKVTSINTNGNDNVLEQNLFVKSVEDDTSLKEKEIPISSSLANNLLEVLNSSQYNEENVTKRRKEVFGNEENVYISKSKENPPPNIEKCDNDSNENCLKIVNNYENKKVSSQKSNNNGLTKSNDKLNKTKNIRLKKNLKSSELTELANSVADIDISCKTDSRKNDSYSDKALTLGTHVSKTKSQDVDKISESVKKVNKTRKLYNPDELIKETIVNDEFEREHKRKDVRKRKSDEGVVLNSNIVTISPNTLVTAKAKQFVDENQINLQVVLNKSTEESENEAKLPKRQKKETRKKRRNQTQKNSDDEQHQLAAEFLNKSNTEKKTTKKNTQKKLIVERRKSLRLSQNPKKQLNFNSSTSSCDEKIMPITPVSTRRSTMEFQINSQLSLKKKLKIDKTKRPSIVCTKLHKDETVIFNQIVRKLGGFVIEDEVSNKTTHLVAGEAKRTINILRAMAMGCWILKHEWLLRSLEEGKWLPEEDYEETDFSPAVQKSRLQRQAFGPTYSMDVFQDCGPIYIAKGTIPRSSDLKELVSLCKGNVCHILRNAAIVVGEYVRYNGIKCVKETWVLDSITFNKKLSLKKYIIPPSNCSPIV